MTRTQAGVVPLRIQRRRTKGWVMPPGAVCVTRPTLWGNPFICDDVTKAVEAYRRHCQGGTQKFEMGGPGGLRFAPNTHPDTLHWAWPEWMRKNLHTLRGRNLACWCHLCPEHAEGKPFGLACAACAPCHSDPLGVIANAP